ncbi:MAG TPA: DNA polymerase III subunit beta [Candidatus Paceibacterota bacterium]|jgi:DNA polymerase-3 subunit beta|nr:DNA polymerase III subunit beta [Candidatus Paceibacterota bacterium]
MKFETTTESLASAVGTAARFAERRANLPVLGCVLITAEGGRLTLRATNLECGIEIVVPAKVTSEGTVAAPAAVLAGFLNNARGKSVSVALVGEVLKVESERASASIKTIPHEDFPILPRVSAEHSFSIKAADLVRAIRSVAYCASLSAVKPELQSVLIYGEAGKLTAVATDSFRLAEKQMPLKSGGSIPQLLVPARNAAELIRVLENVKGDVEIYYNENQLSTQAEDMYYTSRLLDGSFPNYRQVLPKTFSTEGLVLREDMSSALKSLSIFADKFAQVSLAIDPAKKALFLSSRNPDVGEQISTVKATISGDAVAVSFNGRYLADSLQSIVGDSVRLHSNGAGKPMLIKDASDDSFLYLAMPMNR